MNITREQLKLYAVTDRSWLGSETLYEQVEKALKGGVTLVQLREKTLDEAAFEKEGQELLELCHHYNVPLIINDNVELAKKIHADGVHIGQSDMAVSYTHHFCDDVLFSTTVLIIHMRVRNARTILPISSFSFMCIPKFFQSNGSSSASIQSSSSLPSHSSSIILST